MREICSMDSNGSELKLVISAPLDTLATATGLVKQQQQQSDGDKKRLLSRLLDLFKGALPGSELTRLQVPVQLNMPKSQLQLYGESVYCCANDLLGACTKGATPLQRFLHVVAWHISTTRLAPFVQAPFNPILGETHHVSFGNLNVFLEQVSHHPPISTLYATDELADIRLQWWQSPCPRFYGNRVEVNVQGKRELFMDAHKEVYEMTCPKLMIRFFPTLSNEWVGASNVRCKASGLEATILFHPKSFFGLRGTIGHISGHILDSTTCMPLFNFSGSYNGVVTMNDIKTGETSVLFDAQRSFAKLKAPKVQNKNDMKQTESIVVWRAVMEGLIKRDWEYARKAKQDIEEKQRALAKQRKKEGRPWTPEHFELVDGDRWQWRHIGQPVGQSPLIIP